MTRRILSLFVIAFALLATSCSDRVIAVPKEAPTAVNFELVHERDLTDAQKITLLRHEAHKRGLRWRIFCAEFEEKKNHQFLAEAEKNITAEPFILYLEDGAQKQWSEFGATQADAAYNLYQTLLKNEGPNYPGQHKPQALLANKKICLPELKGE